jgi:hypothetical protein
VTQTEPILAWRIWRLHVDPETGQPEPALESPVYGDPWPEARAFKALCDRWHPVGRPAPLAPCGCGIYAVTNRDAAAVWARWAQSALPHPIVIGRVQLWGRVLPHSHGYRAEVAYPYELEVLDDDESLGRGLRAGYLVDVARLVAA